MGRGSPRIQYERTVVLLPPTADSSWANTVTDATWNDRRFTLSNSADDAGVGDLDKRTVIAVNPHLWPGNLRLEEFFWEHYPGVRFIPLVTSGLFGLMKRLEYITSSETLLDLAQYTSWQRNPYWTAAQLSGSSCNKTIGNLGCFATGIGITQRRLGIRPKATPATVNKELGPDGFNGCDVKYSAAAERCGVRITRHLNQDLGSIRAWVEAGNVALIEVQPTSLQHFVVAVAYHNGDFAIIDPLYGDMVQLHERYNGVESWRQMELAETPPPPALNVKGVHGSPILSPPPAADQDYWIQEMKKMGIGWYKALNPGGGSEHLRWYTKLLENGISPIIRFFVAEALPNPLPDEFFALAYKLAELPTDVPIYVEPFNEPNLTCEWQWPWRERVDYNDPEIIRIINDRWFEAAVPLVEIGVVPLYPAMAPTNRNGNNERYSSVEFYRRGAKYLSDNYYDKMKSMLAKKEVGIAVHISPFTRPLDYNPYNPNFVDDMCIRGWEPAYDRFQLEFGLEDQELLIMSTEGGVYSPEHIEYLEWGPAYSEAEWARKTLETYKYIEEETPLLALCTWILTDQGVLDTRWKRNGWYLDKQPRPIVNVLKEAT